MIQERYKEIRIVVHNSWEGGPRTFCRSCYVATYQVVMERYCSLTAAVDVRGDRVSLTRSFEVDAGYVILVM